MKTWKKVFSALLAMVMVITTLTVIPVTDVEAKVTILSPKKAKETLEVGENTYIIVKQKDATFKTSNKNIATVDKKAKKFDNYYSMRVVAKKVGKCKITVKVGKKKKKVTITVIPATPTMKSVSTVGSNSATSLAQTATIRAKWGKVKGASGYVMYYSANKDTGYQAKEIKGGTTTSATASGLVYGKYYYVKVKAYAYYKGKKVFCPDYSGVKYVKTYMMKWNDEFGGDTLDTTKWNWEGATGWGGYGNRELQNYQPEYCKMENGSIVIMPTMYWDPAKKEIMNDEVQTNQKKCYSTKLWTKPDADANIEGYTTKYGKVEFRAKLPKGEGTWAACWMLGQLDESYSNRYLWPNCGEIDVLETTFAKAKTKIPQTIHCIKFNGMSTSSGSKNVTTVVPTATSQYHTYAIEWTTTEIRFYIDGQYTWTYAPKTYVTSGNGTNDPTIWPYNHPFYLILNCAIGGVLGVDSSPNAEMFKNVSDVNPEGWTYIGKDESSGAEIYQDYMYIDYVRVFQ